MKRTLTLLALVAIATTRIVQAGDFPAPLPEFMDHAQIAKWKADLATKEAATPASSDNTTFYTGKPYVADAGGYVYKYRTYNPEMSRWTSADPSGFPDGVNNFVYTANPLKNLDPNGLLTVTGDTTPVQATVTYDSGTTTYTVTAEDISTFSGSSSLSGTLDITSYTAAGSGANGGVEIEISVSGVSSQANTIYHWIQSITTSDPLNGQTSPYIDNGGASNPFYDTNGDASASNFHDLPTRPYADATSGSPVTWEAALQYVGLNTVTGAITNYGGITYGFTITE